MEAHFEAVQARCSPKCVDKRDSAGLLCINLIAFATNDSKQVFTNQELDHVFDYEVSEKLLEHARHVIAMTVYNHLENKV